MRLYIGNLPWSATAEELRGALEEFGSVQEVKIIQDRETGRSKGFGFAEMDERAGLAAIAALRGADYGGRRLNVSEAKPKRPEGGSNHRPDRRRDDRRRDRERYA